MNEHRRVLLLIGIMAAVVAVVSVVSMALLYSAAFDEQKARLTEMAQSQARLAESMFRHARSSGESIREAEASALSQLRETAARTEWPSRTGELVMAERQGRWIQFLVRRKMHNAGALDRISAEGNSGTPMIRALSGIPGVMVGIDYRGKKVLAAYDMVDGPEWGVVAKIEIAEIQAPFRRAALLAGLAALVLAFAGALLFVKITNPMLRRIRESEERYAETINAVNDRLWVWHVPSGNAFFSATYYSLLGYEDGEFPATYDSWRLLVHPEDIDRVDTDLKKSIDTAKGFSIDLRMRKKTGEWLWVCTRGNTIEKDAHGKTLRTAGTLSDITERIRAEDEIRTLNAELEQRVVDRTIQLEASNKELEAFCYSVSHDLRTPLRAIEGFSSAIVEEYGTLLDAEGQNYLRRVRAATERMSDLIDDLLKLSRVSRDEMHRINVCLSDLANAVIERLQETEPERPVSVAVEPGMMVKGDVHLLSVVLENLLGNAWKFTGNQPQASIEFGVTQSKGEPVYYVRDNGAGFDMAYAGKLFGAFQRLHSTDEFPGTGIGLATAQRIINRHGGRIWAESEVGKGTTFYFTLHNN